MPNTSGVCVLCVCAICYVCGGVICICLNAYHTDGTYLSCIIRRTPTDFVFLGFLVRMVWVVGWLGGFVVCERNKLRSLARPSYVRAV